MKSSLVICGSGHRPQKFVRPDYPWDAVCHDMWHLCYSALHHLVEEGKTTDVEIISGMALGWDTELCDVAQYLRLPVRAYIPFVGQESKWGKYSQERYHKLLDKCVEVKVISEGGYSPEKMQIRNKAMVDDSKVVLCLWDGSNGGTGNCLGYANRVKKPIINLYPNWVSGESVGKVLLSYLR
jgi:uncharacterized phage-like protein YoqJ